MGIIQCSRLSLGPPSSSPVMTLCYGLLLVMNAQPYLTIVPSALITQINLFPFLYVFPQGFSPFFHSECPTFLLLVSDWLTPGISFSFSFLLFSPEPRFLLLLILSAHQPHFSLYCLPIGCSAFDETNQVP